jgi:histidine phosphotransfer protein HptB
MKNLSNVPENFISWEDSVSRVGGEEDFLVELLTDLREMVRDNIEKIINSLTKVDFKEIRELAHSMKGASGNLGLNTMYEATMKLEESAKDQNANDICKYLEALKIDYKNLEALLQN